MRLLQIPLLLLESSRLLLICCLKIFLLLLQAIEVPLERWSEVTNLLVDLLLLFLNLLDLLLNESSRIVAFHRYAFANSHLGRENRWVVRLKLERKEVVLT